MLHGVVPGCCLPSTAQDVPAGRGPDVTEALELLPAKPVKTPLTRKSFDASVAGLPLLKRFDDPERS